MRTCSAWALVAAACLCFAPAAAGARPSAGQVFGGGATVSSSAATGPSLVTLRPSADLRTIRGVAELGYRCTGNVSSGASLQLRGALSRSGTFSLSAPVRVDGSVGLETGTARIAGRFATATRAMGTITLATTIRLPSGALRSCRIAGLRFRADLPGGRGERGTRAASARFYGLADFDGETGTAPVVLAVSADGRRVARFTTPYGARCKSGKLLQETRVFGSAPISSGGSFLVQARFRSDLGDGATADFAAAIAGRFGGRAVRGALRVRAVVRNAAGEQIDVCDTKTQPFSASR